MGKTAKAMETAKSKIIFTQLPEAWGIRQKQRNVSNVLPQLTEGGNSQIATHSYTATVPTKQQTRFDSDLYTGPSSSVLHQSFSHREVLPPIVYRGF